MPGNWFLSQFEPIVIAKLAHAEEEIQMCIVFYIACSWSAEVVLDTTTGQYTIR